MLPGHILLYKESNLPSSEDIIKLMEISIKYGADIHALDINQRNLLSTTIEYYNDLEDFSIFFNEEVIKNTYEIIKFFINKKLDIHAKDLKGLSAAELIVNTCPANSKKIINHFIETRNDSNINQTDSNSNNLLHLIAKRPESFIKEIKGLVEKGINIDLKNNQNEIAWDIIKKNINLFGKDLCDKTLVQLKDIFEKENIPSNSIELTSPLKTSKNNQTFVLV